LDDKIAQQKPKGGQIFNATTIRNFITVMAYSGHKFSDESWLVITDHLIQYLSSNTVQQKSFIESCLYCLNKHHAPIPKDLLV
jgi:hypothetical protein